jgi:predicted dehydrogenase
VHLVKHLRRRIRQQVVQRKISPNEKLNVAAIGAGGKGLSDIMSCHKLGHNVVALCDVDWKRAEEAFYRLPKAKKYKDYRNMLEEMKEIDAVTISTRTIRMPLLRIWQ